MLKVLIYFIHFYNDKVEQDDSTTHEKEWHKTINYMMEGDAGHKYRSLVKPS